VSTHLCQFSRLGGGEHALRDRRGDRLHRGREIRRLAHRRERQWHQPFAVRRNETVETEPQRGWVAAKGELDGFAGQGLGFALQQQLGSEGRSIARSARPAGGVAGTALLKWASPLFLLFLQEIISSLNFSPQKSKSWGHVAREGTAGLVPFASHCQLDAHRFVAIKTYK